MNDAPKNPSVTRFDTTMFVLIDPQYVEENAPQGVVLHLTTPLGTSFETYLTPGGMGQLYFQLHQALSRRASLPPIPQFMGLSVPGNLEKAEKTAIHFGQEYDVGVLQALGLLTIRANLLDDVLIQLLATAAEMKISKARDMYYSTSNMKARLDQIRSLSRTGFSERTERAITDALDRVKKAADRRNDLVHARWTFRGGKHRANVYRPNARTQNTELTVTRRFVELIAEAYVSASMLVIGASQQIDNDREEAAKAARSTA